MANLFDNIDPVTGAATAPRAPNYFDTVSLEAPRGVFGELATAIKRGALVDLPQMAGQALKYTSSPGNAVYDFGQSMDVNAQTRGEDPNLQLRPEQHGAVVNALAEGAQMVPSVVAPLAAAAGAVAALPVELPALAATGLTMAGMALPFAAQSGQQTLETAAEKHIPEDKALAAARMNAGVTFASQTALGLVGAQMFGRGATIIGKAVGKEAAPLAEQTMAELTGSGGIIKPFLKQLPISAAEAASVNAVQAGAVTKVNNEYGIDDTNPLDAALQSVPATLGLTAILSPFGLAARALKARTLNARAQKLADPETHPEIRDQLATQYFTELNKKDPEAAKQFALNVETAIKNKLPVEVDAGLFLKGAVEAPVPPKQLPNEIRAPAEIPISPEAQEAARQADNAVLERQVAKETEDNRRALVDTHEQIKTELTAAGITPTPVLAYKDFVKAMNREAKKSGTKLTQAEFERMYAKHQNDVMTENIRKAKELSPPSAEPTALGNALQDATKRMEVDERPSIEQRVAELPPEVRQQMRKEGLITTPMPHAEVISVLRQIAEPGQSLPPRIVQDVTKAVQGVKTHAEQIEAIRKLSDSKKNTNSLTYQLLDQLYKKLNPNGEQLAAPAEVAVQQIPAHETKKRGGGRTTGTTDDRHTVGPPTSVDDMHPTHMTLEQARKSAGGIFTEKAWWQDLAWAVRNPETKIGKELLENGKFTDEQMGLALKKDEAYVRQDALLETMRVRREAALREMLLAEAQPEKAREILDAKTLQNIFGGEEGDFTLDKAALSETRRAQLDKQDVAAVREVVKNSATVAELLPKLLSLTKVPELRRLIQELQRIGMNTRVMHYDKYLVTKDGKAVFGRYSATHDVVIVPRGGATVETVMHEIVHGAVWFRVAKASEQATAIKEGRLDMVSRLDQQRITAVNDLFDIYHDAKILADKLGETHYGLRNIQEFVAELTTDQRLQKLLRGGEAGGVWTRVLDVIKRLLGLRMPANSLDKALSLSKEFYGVNDASIYDPANAKYFETVRKQPASLDKFESAPAGAMYQTGDILGKLARVVDNASTDMGTKLTRLHITATSLNYLKNTFGKLLPGLGDHADAKGRVTALVATRNHAAQIVRDHAASLSAKDLRTLEGLVETSRLNIFPDRAFEDQPWLKPSDKAEHRRLSQAYKSSADVRRVYDEILSYNKDDYARERAVRLRDIGYLFDAPEALWKDIKPLEKAERTPEVLAAHEKAVTALEDWLLTKGSEDAQDTVRSMRTEHQQRVNSPYFHLGRFGDYYNRITIKDTPEAREAFTKVFKLVGADKDTALNERDLHLFTRYETESARQMVAEQFKILHAQGHLTEFQSGKLQSDLTHLDNMGPRSMRNMLAKVDVDPRLDADQKAEFKAIMRRINIESAPENSLSKVFAKRTGVAGYSTDIIKSFTKRAQASSYFVAHSMVRPELAEANRKMKAGIAALANAESGSADFKNGVVAQFVYDELAIRQKNEMSPIHTPVIDAASTIGYSWFLMGNPAFLLSNLTQPGQTALPVIGGRHGHVKSFIAMTRASGMAFGIIKSTIGEGWVNGKWRGVLDATVILDGAKATAGEKSAIKALIASGQAQLTQSHMTSSEHEQVNTAAKVGSALTHYSEVVNRITVAVTAYNMEFKRALKDNGGDRVKAQQTAETYAIGVVKDTQFDYSASNAQPWTTKYGMLGPAAPLVTQFMRFNMFTLELLGRLSQDAFKGETSEVRAEARRALGGLMATTTMLAGTLGLPFVGLVSAAYNKMFSDEDTPVDMVADYRNFLADTFGQEAGELIAHGPVRAADLDFASHLSFANIVPGTRFLNDRRQLKDRFDSGALALLGPTVGAGAGFIQGVEKIADGDYFGGLEKMLPTFLKAPVKATNLAINGPQDLKGEPLPLDINSWDIAAQAANFTPTKIAEQREAQRSVNTTAALLRQRASDLEDKRLKAFREQDADAMASVTEDIKKFNEANPDFAIRGIRSILRNRAIQASVAMQSGAAVEGRMRQLPRIQEQARFANTGGMIAPPQ